MTVEGTTSTLDELAETPEDIAEAVRLAERLARRWRKMKRRIKK